MFIKFVLAGRLIMLLGHEEGAWINKRVTMLSVGAVDTRLNF